MFSDPNYSVSVCQKKLWSNPKLIFFTKFNLMITQFCVAILVTFNVNVTLCHCTVTQVTQVIDFVARARFKSQVWLWLETRVMCRAPWKLVSRKLARYLLGSTNPHPCSPVAANGQWSHWNYCPLRCFELHVRRQIDNMCHVSDTSNISCIRTSDTFISLSI